MNIGSLSKFQLIFFSISIVVVIAAVGIFALNKASNGGAVSEIVIWGTLPETTFNNFVQQNAVSTALETKKVSVKYFEKPAETFDADVVEAISSGAGPDAVIITQDATLQYLNKIVQIPFSSFSERNFRDLYIQEAELFLTKTGITAMPFTVDPMVMYWNRTMFSNAGIANPPTLWSQFYADDGVISKINKIDKNHNIIKTALAFGAYNNVSHAKDILALLMLQAGSPIVQRGDNNTLRVALSSSNSSEVKNGAQAALNFYTQFADPTKSIYSWNSSLSLSRNAFTSGDLALYFGYASEVNNLATRNPNLNFDLALVPQSQSSNENITFGNMYGISILKSSKNANAAFDAGTVLSSAEAQSVWSKRSGLPPIVRSLLVQKPEGIFDPVFYEAALQSRGWLDPNRTETETIFGDMISSVISGRMLPEEAIQGSESKFSKLLSGFSN